ncbi:unnamed protein product [Linum trigynum]|uniref:Uncharacterized protein n=1 Tax=Linum trigynum TaxID=586398 RepID=A0AAV2DY69_9ROSI
MRGALSSCLAWSLRLGGWLFQILVSLWRRSVENQNGEGSRSMVDVWPAHGQGGVHVCRRSTRRVPPLTSFRSCNRIPTRGLVIPSKGLYKRKRSQLCDDALPSHSHPVTNLRPAKRCRLGRLLGWRFWLPPSPDLVGDASLLSTSDKSFQSSGNPNRDAEDLTSRIPAGFEPAVKTWHLFPIIWPVCESPDSRSCPPAGETLRPTACRVSLQIRVNLGRRVVLMGSRSFPDFARLLGGYGWNHTHREKYIPSYHIVYGSPVSIKPLTRMNNFPGRGEFERGLGLVFNPMLAARRSLLSIEKELSGITPAEPSSQNLAVAERSGTETSLQLFIEPAPPPVTGVAYSPSRRSSQRGFRRRVLTWGDYSLMI